MKDVGDGRTSNGAKLIINDVIKEDPRPIFILSNGGMNTLAQALFVYRAEHSSSQIA